ncbi:MAG: hypothetical protein AAFY19_00330 [Pseudomonadota bacterium]
MTTVIETNRVAIIDTKAKTEDRFEIVDVNTGEISTAKTKQAALIAGIETASKGYTGLTRYNPWA